MLVRNEELALLARNALSKRLYRHYSGFAKNQLAALRESEEPTVKKALYALRTALTGTHVLLTGDVMTDVTLLLDDYGFETARELVQRKRCGERTPLPQTMRRNCVAMAERALTLLDEALACSPLPAEPRNTAECEDWLLGARKKYWN